MPGTSPVSLRTANSSSYADYVRRQQQVADVKVEVPGGPKLFKQMVIGFICAAFVGLVMLILGSIFIAKAVNGRNSVTVMLCVLGIVCGLIVLVGTAILGRLFISRKWRVQHGRQPPHQPPQACFHTCSIIYTPSQDQIAGIQSDLPPSYEMVVLNNRRPSSSDDDTAGSVDATGGDRLGQPIVMVPPNYAVAAAPLPGYGDPV